MTKNELMDKISASLTGLYDKAITTDIPLIGSALDLGDQYLRGNGTLSEKIDSLIRWQTSKAGMSGFTTGLPGWSGIPIDIASTLFIQIRMVAAIAHMCELDVHDEKTRVVVTGCLAGQKALDTLRSVGVAVTHGLGKKLVRSVSNETIKAINKAVGARIVVRYTGNAVINLSKLVPVLSGITGAALDSAFTYSIGKTAKKLLLEVDKN